MAHLREIDFTEPDARQYPEFDEMLRYAIVEETHRFFREILDQDRPLLDFVDSDWTILNERLARHYGIEGVTGQDFRRVPLPPGSVRGGVLTQASILKVTANGTNTSPVVRGVWVLENILGQPAPPPPADVPAIEPDIRGRTTIREQLRSIAMSNRARVCHSRIDPPGFALESFDPIGGCRDWYRSLGEGEPVDLEFVAIAACSTRRDRPSMRAANSPTAARSPTSANSSNCSSRTKTRSRAAWPGNC